jgi:hypothetical protein
MNEDRPAEPSTYGKHGLAQKRKRRPGRIQAAEPSPQRRGIGDTIRIFDCWRRGFQGKAFQEKAPQRLAAGDEAVMAVGRRKGRQKRKRLTASIAAAATSLDPIVMFIMRLFAAAAMADDGVLGTNRAPAQCDFRARLGPINFEVVLGEREWDKQNRKQWRLRPIGVLARSATGAEPSSSKKASPGKE